MTNVLLPNPPMPAERPPSHHHDRPPSRDVSVSFPSLGTQSLDSSSNNSNRRWNAQNWASSAAYIFDSVADPTPEYLKHREKMQDPPPVQNTGPLSTTQSSQANVPTPITTWEASVRKGVPLASAGTGTVRSSSSVNSDAISVSASSERTTPPRPASTTSLPLIPQAKALRWPHFGIEPFSQVRPMTQKQENLASSLVKEVELAFQPRAPPSNDDYDDDEPGGPSSPSPSPSLAPELSDTRLPTSNSEDQLSLPAISPQPILPQTPEKSMSPTKGSSRKSRKGGASNRRSDNVQNVAKVNSWLLSEEMHGHEMPMLLTWRFRKGVKGKVTENETPLLETQVYEQACKSLGVIPHGRVCEALKSPDAMLKNCHLGRKKGEALARAMAQNSIVTKLDLTGCGVDSVVLRHIVEALLQMRIVTFLDLSDNQIGRSGAAELKGLLERVRNDPMPMPLKVLKLNKCALGNKGVMQICGWLATNEVLQELHLTGNHIRDSGVVCLADMLRRNRTIQVLDLSWNSVKDGGALALKDTLLYNTSVNKLALGWNGLDDVGGVAIGEMLLNNTGLEELDLSNCRLGPDAAMVLAEGLKKNEVLKALILHGNPLGDDGGRHLMIALQENQHLRTLGLQGCSFTDVIKGAAVFDHHNPDGHYRLNLSNTSEYSVAIQLVNLGQHNPSSWKHVYLDSRSLGNAYPSNLNWHMQYEVGEWQLPTHGTLELDYVTTLGPPGEAVVIEAADLENLLQQLGSRRISDYERLNLLTMFISSHYFTCEQASRIVDTFSTASEERVNSAVLVFARLVDTENLEALFYATSSTAKDRSKFFAALGFVRYFQAKNPTGHYELNLAVQVDRLVMHKLIAAARLEGEGESHTNIRNIVYNNRFYWGWKHSRDVVWGNVMPEEGYVRLDFTTDQPLDAGRRSTPGGGRARSPAPAVQHAAEPISDAALAALVEDKFGNANLPSDERVVQLRMASANLAISCQQCISLLALFDHPEERSEVAVIMWARLTDRHDNFWRVLYSLKGLEQMFVCNRLGYRHTYDPRHPSIRYRLDTADPEQRNVAVQLITWAAKFPHQSIHNMLVNGRAHKGSLVEDSSLWTVLTNNAITGPDPVLEFDYAHNNFFEEVLGVPAPQQAPKVREILIGYHRRRALDRCCLMHAYWIELANWVRLPDPFAETSKAPANETASGTPEARPSTSGSRGQTPGTARKTVRASQVQMGTVHKTAIAGADQEDLQALPVVHSGSALEKALLRTGARSLRPHHWQMGWDREMRRMTRQEKDWIEDEGATPLKLSFWKHMDTDDIAGISWDEFRLNAKEVMGLTDADTSKLSVLFKEGDVDGDSMITWEEFEDVVLRGKM